MKLNKSEYLFQTIHKVKDDVNNVKNSKRILKDVCSRFLIKFQKCGNDKFRKEISYKNSFLLFGHI